MKIVFLNFYGGFINRGVETHVDELATRLAKNNTVVVCQSKKIEGKPYEVLEVKTKADFAKPFKKYSLGWRLYLDYWSRQIFSFTRKTLKVISRDTDIVIPCNGGWQSLLVRLWTWRAGAKMLVVGHSGLGYDDRINLWCRPDRFVALSDFQADWARKNSADIKVSVIPNGVDTKKFSSAGPKAKSDLPKPIVLCPASLEPDKNIVQTIQAVASLDKVSLIVLGRGSLEKEYTNVGKKLLGSRFAINAVDPREMPAYYRLADVVVMAPSSGESFGISLLEAMACGKYVVTTDDPIRREIVDSAGILINPNNIQEFSEAITHGLKLTNSQIPQRQSQKFSWDKISEKYEKLFEEI